MSTVNAAFDSYTMGNGRLASFLRFTLLSGVMTAASALRIVELGDRGTARLNIQAVITKGHSAAFQLYVGTSKVATENDEELEPLDQDSVVDIESGDPVFVVRKRFGALDRFLGCSYELTGDRVGAVTDAAARVGAVVAAGTTPPAAPTVTGTPSGAFNGNKTVVIAISTGGARGTAEYTYAVDGGSASVAASIPNDGIVTVNGLTITFPAGTYGTDNTYTFRTYAAAVTAPTITGAGTGTFLGNKSITFAIDTEGARGTATFKYKVGAGAYSAAVPIPADGIVTLNGLTLTFAEGTYGGTTTYTFDLYEAPEVDITVEGEAV
jgi:hypothetical protein